MTRDPYPLVQAPALSAFATLAEDYCGLIEGHKGTDRGLFLRAAHRLLMVHLTGPTTPPEFTFAADLDHPFAVEQREGVYPERRLEWLMQRAHP